MIFIFFSCKNTHEEKKINEAELNEKLLQINQKLVRNESKEIDKFISSHAYQTQMTGTGLRYEIYKHGEGKHPSYQDEVLINYKIYLLNDSLCYSSDTTKPVKFKLGIGEQIRGLEEGLMLMVPGDKANLIIPSHLAFGNSGDNSAIPPLSPILINVELIKVNSK
jgi:FKBP-type peptidyl-prolyl cis-trans isomerase